MLSVYIFDNVKNVNFFFKRILKVIVSRDEGFVELEIFDDFYDVQRVEVQLVFCIVIVCKVLIIFDYCIDKNNYLKEFYVCVLSIYVGVNFV